MKFTIEEMLAQLPLAATDKWKQGVWDVEAFRLNNFSFIFFAPHETDYQTSHEENEIYIIARGSGELVMDGERLECKTGDAIFVPANIEHHFENFSDDFATWAAFF